MSILHDESGAGIPSQDGIIVVRRPNHLRALVAGHRFPQPFVRLRAAARFSVGEQGLRASLVDDPAVVGAFVFVVQLRDRAPCVRDTTGIEHELVGEGEEQRCSCLLVVGIDGEHVEADAFGLARLVQEPIPFRFDERPGHGIR